MNEPLSNSPDSLADMDESVVMNPRTIGNPDESPRVFVGAALRSWLAPCEGGPEGWCGGVNGSHVETCTVEKGTYQGSQP